MHIAHSKGLCIAMFVAWLLLQTVSLKPGLGQDASAKAMDCAGWSPVALPVNRHGHRVHLIGDELLVIGGFARSGDPAAVSRSSMRYSFTTKQWRSAGKLHVGKAFFGSAVLDGRVYAVGQNIERYDATRDVWEVVSQHQGLPTSHFSAAAIGGDIALVGHKLWLFSPKTRSVVEHPVWPKRKSGDHFHFVAVLDDTLHVIGGLDGETFDPMAMHWTWRDGLWKRQPAAPAAMFAKYSVVEVLDNRLHILGPESSFRFDFRLAEWTRLAPMPTTLAMPGSFVRDSVIHVLGGLSTKQDKPRLCFDPKRDRWSNADPQGRPAQ